MAKTQSFADKVKKKKLDTKISIKVIKWFNDETRGTLRTMERLVKVEDINQIDKIDILK